VAALIGRPFFLLAFWRKGTFSLNMSDEVIFSYALNGPKQGQELRGESIAEELQCDNLAWVHLDRAHMDTREWFTANMSYLEDSVVDALVAEETRPRASSVGDGMMVILRGVNTNEGAAPEDMVSIRIWADARRIVSLRKFKVRAAEDIAQTIIAGTGPTTAGAFLAAMTERLDARIEATIGELDDATDELEERLVAQAEPALRHPITDIRRRTIQLRRHISPQREAVNAMTTAQHDWIDDPSRRRLSHAHDRLSRFVEDLDAIRDRAQVVKDELTNALADRLNRNTYVLSVIAAIFLPLGFLTGLMGINLGGIPGAASANAFWIFSGILVVLVIAQVVIFRMLRWF